MSIGSNKNVFRLRIKETLRPSIFLQYFPMPTPKKKTGQKVVIVNGMVRLIVKPNLWLPCADCGRKEEIVFHSYVAGKQLSVARSARNEIHDRRPNQIRKEQHGDHPQWAQIPRKSWADWRDNVKAQILAQSPRVPPINTDATFDVVYIPGDKIRRDVPGMLDALFIVLNGPALSPMTLSLKTFLGKPPPGRGKPAC